jgi:hypothetical protein
MTISRGRKKKTRLNSKSVNARQTTPIVLETNDMNVGNIRNDMVCFTRSRLDVMAFSARIQRATTWTEYSTAKPTERTKDMFEKPVRLTSASTLNPITAVRETKIVTVISNAPMRLPKKILR